MAMTWQQKYDSAKPSVVRMQETAFADLVPGEQVVIPSPQDVERAIWEIPHGVTRVQRELRRTIARAHDADNVCPVVTGIHLRLVSELAVEALDAGRPPADVTPFWRVVEPGSNIASKLPNGSALTADLRAKESGLTSNPA